MIEPLADQTFCDPSTLPNEQVTVTIEREQSEYGYRKPAEITADRSEDARQIAGPALQPPDDLLFERGRIDGIPIESFLQSLSYPWNVAQRGRQRMRTLCDIIGDEFISAQELIL